MNFDATAPTARVAASTSTAPTTAAAATTAGSSSTARPTPAPGRQNKNAAAIRILYAPGQTFTTWDTAVNNNQVGVGDALAVFVR